MYKVQIILKFFSKASRVLALISFLSGLQPVCFSTPLVDTSAYTKAKLSLLKTLKKKTFDKAYTQSIDRFYAVSCDSLIKQNSTVDNRPVKDILTKLFEVCDQKLRARAINALRIPSLNYDFLRTLNTYKKTSVRNLYMRINISKTQILQSVFDGLLLGDSIKTFAGLREMLYDPYYISSRIELPQYASFKDSLLYRLANGAPAILVKKLTAADTFYSTLVNKSNSRTVKAVSRIRPDDNFDKILPFAMAIFENRITTAEIRELMLVPQDYYHALAEETIRLHTDPDPEISSFLKQPVADLNKKIANHYFIKAINDLHESPDNVRFVSLNTLPALDLYFILLAGSNELVIGGSSALYTSSFLYVYKKFLKETEKEGLDTFFEGINYYQFEQFISNISDYALVDNLVDHLKEVKVAALLGKYLAGLPSKQLSDNEIILNSMTMAEVLYEIRHHEVIRNTLVEKIDSIQKNPRILNFMMYRRMYEGFKDILLDQKNYDSDDTYDVLPVKNLQRDNNMVQVCFFYDDEDASSSFSNSTALYHSKIWDKKDEGNYIVFTSHTGNKMMVFMNKPNTKQGCDSSQDEMLRDIERKGYEVTSYIHRGHSYHLPQSLRKMKTAAQFVFLGSCGGYSQVLKLFDLNPDVHIIATRAVGSKIINDPLLESVNQELVNNNDINWDAFWQQFDRKFQSKLEKDLFSSYIAPNKYIGIKFIRKVFNY
jgi:hypothetical protein